MNVNPVLYSIADALQITLKADARGNVRMSAPLKYALGPWKFDRVAYLESDYTSATAAGMFIKLMGSLWLYIEGVASTSGHMNPLRLSVLNAQKIGLSLTSVSKVARGSHVETNKAIAAGVVLVVNYNHAKKEWVNAQAVRAVGDGPDQGAEHPRTSPTDASTA